MNKKPKVKKTQGNYYISWVVHKMKYVYTEEGIEKCTYRDINNFMEAVEGGYVDSDRYIIMPSNSKITPEQIQNLRLHNLLRSNTNV